MLWRIICQPPAGLLRVRLELLQVRLDVTILREVTTTKVVLLLLFCCFSVDRVKTAFFWIYCF